MKDEEETSVEQVVDQPQAMQADLTNLEHVDILIEQYKTQLIQISAQVQLLEQLAGDLRTPPIK